MSTQLEQAARLALEAMRDAAYDEEGYTLNSDLAEAHDTLRAALEQPAHDEPVAWVCYGSSPDEKHAVDYEQHEIDSIPVGTLLYTRPARKWVGLTDEEFKKIVRDTYNIDLTVPGRYSDDHLLWHAIEAKLREKNT